jgi:endogenous inhibitor of DNA gyrase (YacG/DUF329 family)
MKVRCPQCKKESEYSAKNALRPFCSERCRLIDLGEWAEGRYTIPVTDPNELDEEHLNEVEALLPKDDSDDNRH